MLARAILILSCLLCTRASAQSESEPSAASEATSAEAEPAPSTTTAPPADDPEEVENAVPTEAVPEHAVPTASAALEPASEPELKRPIDADPLFTPAVVLIGSGGAALLASLFTGLGAHGIYNALERDCPNNVCSRDKQSRIDSGETLATVSTVLTGVGIAAAGVGTVLLVLAANREDQPPQSGLSSLRLTSGPTALGVGAAGSF
jgi:hypothetical protein